MSIVEFLWLGLGISGGWIAFNLFVKFISFVFKKKCCFCKGVCYGAGTRVSTVEIQMETLSGRRKSRTACFCDHCFNSFGGYYVWKKEKGESSREIISDDEDSQVENIYHTKKRSRG